MKIEHKPTKLQQKFFCYN